MFQNITEEVYQEEKMQYKARVPYIVKELFKYQNIMIYIITFLMATVSIRNEIVPFGLAMLAACVGSSIPLIGVYIAALLGTAIGNGFSGLMNFIGTSIIYFLLVFIFKPKIAIEERNELVKTGGKLFWACLVVTLIKNIQGIFLLYDVFMGMITAALTYVFYKIFVNGLIGIKELRIKKAFTTEELIATTIIMAIASLAFRNFNVFSINISNVIIIFMIMVLGWKSGMMVGATAGISIGLVTSFVDGTSFIQIMMFAISGVLSGFLNRLGKIGVILGFILGNAILTYLTNGSNTMILYFREIFIASIGLLFVPNNIKIELEDLIGRTKLLSNRGENRLNEAEREEVSDKLKTISNVFYEMMQAKETEMPKIEEEYIQSFLDNMEEIEGNLFYETLSQEGNGIVTDIFKCIQEKEIIVDKDLIAILQNHNHYVFMQDTVIKEDLQEIIRVANRTYKMIQIAIAKEQERNKNLQTINSNLKNVTKIIDTCAEEIVQPKENPFAKKETEIEILLKNKNIPIKNCLIKQYSNKKYIVEIRMCEENARLKGKDVTINIGDSMSKSLGTKVTFQRDKKTEKGDYTQIYASEDKFLMQVGSAKIVKDGSPISGDCNLQMRLEDGKYLLAITDGMGSGKEARESSKLTISLIKNLMVSGFEKEESIKLINSTLSMNTNVETYSSIDMMILDLYVGQAEILKNGACHTYIKNRKNINKIQAKTLPVGIVDKIALEAQTIEVTDGDIIVMCSDGVLESKDEIKKDWIEEFLKNITTNNVQKLADLLLAEAVDNSYGVAKDDMTVIVTKVVKKK